MARGARYALGGMLIGAIVGAWFLWAPDESAVCVHALSLIPASHPRPPSNADCLSILETQSRMELPWTYPSQRRCYVRAPTMEVFHDCGGELAHLPE